MIRCLAAGSRISSTLSSSVCCQRPIFAAESFVRYGPYRRQALLHRSSFIARLYLSNSSKPNHNDTKSTSYPFLRRIQQWTTAAARTVARGVSQTVARVGIGAGEALKASIARMNARLSQATRTAARNVWLTIQARISDATHGARSLVAERVQTVYERITTTFRTTLIDPFRISGSRLGYWALAGIAVYGIASTVPREIARHILQRENDPWHWVVSSFCLFVVGT